MNLAPYHPWIVFIHVFGVILFLLGHGVTLAVIWRLRKEHEPVAVRTLLDLSRRSLNFMSVGVVIWAIGGIAAGFSGNYWTNGRYWIWASLVIAIVVIGLMTPMGRFYFNRIREAVGVNLKTNVVSPDFVADQAAVDAAIASGRPMILASIGISALVIMSWLMIVKPF